jgi:glycosyltransferase involved in cell wall biosynthesis
MDVAVLIPAHDEADSVDATVRAACAIPGAVEVLVIDDGSSDDTATRAEKAGARVHRLAQNVGKGAALDTGLAHLDSEWSALLLLDADLGASASQATLLLEPIDDGSAEMTIAAFPAPEGPAGFGLVKDLARRGVKELGDASFEATAPLSGQRALTRRTVDVVTPFAFGYGVEVALTVRALRAGLRVVEVPTTMAHDATGRDVSGFIHRGRQYVHVRRALRMLRREARSAGPDSA